MSVDFSNVWKVCPHWEWLERSSSLLWNTCPNIVTRAYYTTQHWQEGLQSIDAAELRRVLHTSLFDFHVFIAPERCSGPSQTHNGISNSNTARFLVLQSSSIPVGTESCFPQGLFLPPQLCINWLRHVTQSWHFLGPVTRFQTRSEKVKYEIAQVTVIVDNRSPESEGINVDGITVYAEDKVRLPNAVQLCITDALPGHQN